MREIDRQGAECKSLNRVCPICGNEKGEILHTQKFVLEDGNPLPVEYDVVACCRCSFVFADVLGDQSIYDRYYRDFSKYVDENTASGVGTKPWDKSRLHETASYLMNFCGDKDSSVLDIGSGGGGYCGNL